MEEIAKTVEKSKVKNKLSEESAREQMQNLLDSYDINKDDLEIENGPEWIASVINRIVRAIRAGHVEILDNGEVTHNLVTPKGDISSITYRRMNGIAMKERGKAKGTFEKDCALMGSLGNIPPNAMAKLDMVDISIFQRLGQLFMVI
jgi:hypothetical protein